LTFPKYLKQSINRSWVCCI